MSERETRTQTHNPVKQMVFEIVIFDQLESIGKEKTKTISANEMFRVLHVGETRSRSLDLTHQRRWNECA